MNEGPKIVNVPHNNAAVLDALVALTGQHFGFDEPAWANWHAAQKKPVELDARRD
jgi:hypothetical protein